MALALDAYGATGYEVRGYETRQDALRDAAVALEATGSPVILLAWRGAHTWVMTGYRADADPTFFRDATVEGAYVLDPWYPWVSSIWGPSDPPGTFQDAAEMERNYLRWKRPEGAYPERDGLFISVVPTVAVDRAVLTRTTASRARETPEQEERRAARPLPPCPRHTRAGWRGSRAARSARTTLRSRPRAPTNEDAAWRIVSCVAYRPRERG